jgi:hypothetical protein
MTEDEQIDLFAMLEALNDNPEDNSSERYFPIFDYILKINGNGLGKAPHSISVSERHWRAYQNLYKHVGFKVCETDVSMDLNL